VRSSGQTLLHVAAVVAASACQLGASSLKVQGPLLLLLAWLLLPLVLLLLLGLWVWGLLVLLWRPPSCQCRLAFRGLLTAA
jgi:hypothetical protein